MIIGVTQMSFSKHLFNINLKINDWISCFPGFWECENKQDRQHTLPLILLGLAVGTMRLNGRIQLQILMVGPSTLQRGSSHRWLRCFLVSPGRLSPVLRSKSTDDLLLGSFLTAHCLKREVELLPSVGTGSPGFHRSPPFAGGHSCWLELQTNSTNNLVISCLSDSSKDASFTSLAFSCRPWTLLPLRLNRIQ